MAIEYVKLDRGFGPANEADATLFDDYLFMKTQMGWSAGGSVVSPGDFTAQFERSFHNVGEIVTSAGGSLKDVVRVRYPFLDGRNYISCRRVRHGIWPEEGPATSVVICYGLPEPQAVASVEAIAYLGSDRDTVGWSGDFAGRETTPDYSPEIRGKVGFSPAIRGGNIVFMAGQTALDPNDNYVHLGDPEAQTRYTHDNNMRVLGLLGGQNPRTARLFHFGPYPQYFDVVHRVTTEYFPERPASSSIMAALGWPGNIIESEITAAVGVEPVYHATEPFVADTGSSAAVQVGRLLFTSGVVARDAGGDLVGPGDAAAQFRQVFKNLSEVLQRGGTDCSRLLLLNVYVAATTILPVWEEAKAEFARTYLHGDDLFPPYSAMAVSALPSFEHLVQVEAIAAVE